MWDITVIILLGVCFMARKSQLRTILVLIVLIIIIRLAYGI